MGYLDQKTAVSTSVQDVSLADAAFGTAPEGRLSDCVMRALAALPEKEAAVLRMGYGLETKELSPGRIAERLGVSVQEVVNLGAQALRSLYRPILTA